MAKKSTALTNWDEELSKQAAEGAAAEAATGGAKFFSLKGGVLRFGETQAANNEVAAVIVDHCFGNVSYDGSYNPDNPSGPRCFAFARREEDLKPHEKVVAVNRHICDTCAKCPRNAWGTGTRNDGKPSKGKACRNGRRLALLPAGTLNAKGRLVLSKPSEMKEAALAFLNLPVSSTREFSTYVQQLNANLKRPPLGVVTKIKVVPDPKTQFKVIFEPLQALDASYLDVVIKRKEEAALSIMQPYEVDVEAKGGKAKSGAKGRGKAAKERPAPQAAGGRKRKY